MFAGQMGCEALNFGLKRLIREERPQCTHISIERQLWQDRKLI